MSEELFQVLISLMAPSLAILIFLGFLFWKRTFSRPSKIAKGLKKIGYEDLEFDWTMGSSIIIRTDNPDQWPWKVELHIFKDKSYISFDVWVPRDHEYFQYVPENQVSRMTWGLDTNDPEEIHELIVEILEDFQRAFDQQLEWEKTKEAPLQWSEIHSWSDANRAMLKAFHDLERIPKLGEQTKALKPLLETLRDMNRDETRKKERLETKDAHWIKIEEGPATGYLITAIPLEENDIGSKGKDKWKGVFKAPGEDKPHITQTAMATEDGALEAIKEVAEIQIEEGSIPSLIEEGKTGMSKKETKTFSDELWEGIEYLRNEYRLQDSEKNFHTFDLEAYGYPDDKSPEEMERDARIFMKRWTALEGRTFTKVKENRNAVDEESELYDFYFDPPYENEDEIEESVLKIYGKML